MAVNTFIKDLYASIKGVKKDFKTDWKEDSKKDWKADFATVAAAPAPVSAFTATPLTGAAPLTVTFTSGSTGTISSYAWTFGDGSTSTEQNPVHTYATAGSYTISLTVTGPGGSNVGTRTSYVVAA